MQTETIIQINDLVKIYHTASGREIRAVDGVGFTVNKGEIFGLLGPNGAGKTTTISMLTSRVKITSGQIVVAGHDIGVNGLEAKRKIGVVPQVMGLDRSLSAWENLIFHAKYFGVPKKQREKRAKELLSLMDLTDRANDYPSKFSEGMARRLTIARALMHDPEVVILDEATTGLDPQSRHMIWHKILELNEEGHTVFLTTHYMEEADQLCQRIAIMDKGKILAIDKTDNLKKLVSGGNVVELKTSAHPEELGSWLKEELKDLHQIDFEDKTMKLYLDHPEENLMKIINIAQRHEVKVEAIQLHGVTLEDVFISLTGKGLRE